VPTQSPYSVSSGASNPGDNMAEPGSSPLNYLYYQAIPPLPVCLQGDHRTLPVPFTCTVLFGDVPYKV